MFSAFGIHEVIACDNGSSFTSYDFKHFIEYNGVRLLFSPPYHPVAPLKTKLALSAKLTLNNLHIDNVKLKISLKHRYCHCITYLMLHTSYFVLGEGEGTLEDIVRKAKDADSLLSIFKIHT